jgi:hypothetical protein
MASYDDIVTSLSTLSKTQLEDLRKRISAFLSIGVGASVVSIPREMGDVDLCQAIVIEVLALRGCGYLSNHQFSGMSGFNKFRDDHVPNVMKFVRGSIPGGRRIEFRSMMHLGVQMLCENLAEMKQPVTHGNVMRQFYRIPDMFDKAFPGYASMGLLGMVMQQEMTHHVRTEHNRRTEVLRRSNDQRKRQK